MSNLSLNQFQPTTVPGQPDLQFGGSVVTCEVASTQATPIIPGQVVKIADTNSKIPQILGLAANTEASFGVALRNPKDVNFPALSRVEVGIAGTVVYMTAGAAIARFAKLEFVYTTNKVITNAGTNPVMGYAFDKAAADGDIIRVYILNPQVNAQVIADIAGLQTALNTLQTNIDTANANAVHTAIVTATLAEINAGKTLVAGVTGKKITVLNFIERVLGNFAATTSVDVQSSNVTPVKVAVAAVAALTTGAVLIPGTANVTLGAGFGAQLGTGDGLVVANVGSAATTGTSITYTITYAQA